MSADCTAALQFARARGAKAIAVLRHVRLKWLHHFCYHWYFPPQAKSPLFVALWLEGRVVGVFATEFGTLNQFVHMVAFEDLADRAVRRATLRANPE